MFRQPAVEAKTSGALYGPALAVALQLSALENFGKICYSFFLKHPARNGSSLVHENRVSSSLAVANPVISTIPRAAQPQALDPAERMLSPWTVSRIFAPNSSKP